MAASPREYNFVTGGRRKRERESRGGGGKGGFEGGATPRRCYGGREKQHRWAARLTTPEKKKYTPMAL